MNWLKKHKILTVIGAIVLLAIIGSAAGGGSNTNTAKSNGSKAEASKTDTEVTLAKIGEAAADGKFEFVVKSVECGKTSVGGQYLTKTPQGQYCLLNVTVKNIGDESQGLLSSNQKLFNAEGKQYAADDTATAYAAPDGGTWYSDINPGNSVEGIIVFDLPKDQVPVSAELHDSSMSGGVIVNLQ